MSDTVMKLRKNIRNVSAAEFTNVVSTNTSFSININKIDMSWANVQGLTLGGTLITPLAGKIVANFLSQAIWDSHRTSNYND
jgi:hypothetical protein